MPRPYSHDFRVRVIGAVEGGLSARGAGRLFGVSASRAVKWVGCWRRSGSVAVKRMGGYKRSPLDAHADVLLWLVADRPDLTVEEIRAELRARGICTGPGAVRRFFDRHGISFKNNRARRRAGSAGRGGGARMVARRQPPFDPRRLVFIDETWAKWRRPTADAGGGRV